MKMLTTVERRLMHASVASSSTSLTLLNGLNYFKWTLGLMVTLLTTVSVAGDLKVAIPAIRMTPGNFGDLANSSNSLLQWANGTTQVVLPIAIPVSLPLLKKVAFPPCPPDVAQSLKDSLGIAKFWNLWNTTHALDTGLNTSGNQSKITDINSPCTIFAIEDNGFAKYPQLYPHLQENPLAAREFLSNHIVIGPVPLANLNKPLTTSGGLSLKPTHQGDATYINGIQIGKDNIQLSSGGNVYVITGPLCCTSVAQLSRPLIDALLNANVPKNSHTLDDTWDRPSISYLRKGHLLPTNYTIQARRLSLGHGGDENNHTGINRYVYRSPAEVVPIGGPTSRYGPNNDSVLHVMPGLSGTSFLTLLQLADCRVPLSRKDPVTLFLPSDEAISNLPPRDLKTLLSSPDRLKQALLYHIAPGTYTSDVFSGNTSITSIEGQPLHTDSISNGTLKTVEGAKVILSDIVGHNGVIHIIDRFLYPIPNGTLVDTLEKLPKLKLFLDLLKRVNLTDLLRVEEPYTVFAPNNEALKNISTSIPSTPEGNKQLRVILLNHLVPGIAYTASWSPAQTLPTAGGHVVYLQYEPNESGGFNLLPNGATVSKSDIGATNGVIHILNDVMPVDYFPTPQAPRRTFWQNIWDTVLGLVGRAKPATTPSHATERPLLTEGKPSDDDLVATLKKLPNAKHMLDALNETGLITKLKKNGPYTIFVPVNSAFEHLRKPFLDFVNQNRTLAENILLNHIVPNELLCDELKKINSANTLEGKQLIISPSEAGCAKVDNTEIIYWNITAKDGVIHLIDKIIFLDELPEELLPSSTEVPFYSTSEEAREEYTTPVTTEEGLPSSTTSESVPFATATVVTVSTLEPSTTETHVPSVTAIVEGVTSVGTEISTITSSEEGVSTVISTEESISVVTTEIPISTTSEETIPSVIYTTEGVTNITEEVVASSARPPPEPGYGFFPEETEEANVSTTILPSGRGVSDLYPTSEIPVLYLPENVSDMIVPRPSVNFTTITPKTPTTLTDLLKQLNATLFPNLLNKTALDKTLSIPDPLTLFVPTDEAFKKVDSATLDKIISDPEQLRRVLLYHVIPTRIPGEDLPRALQAGTLAGVPVFITVYVIKEKPTPLVNNATILPVQYESDNTIVFLIDKVLIAPPEGDIFTTISKFLKEDTTKDHIIKARLDPVLTGPGPLTMFVPTERAWNSLPQSVKEHLTTNITALKEYILGHIVAGAIFTPVMTEGSQFKTLNGKTLTVTHVNGGIRINNGLIIQPDIVATNGVIHVIDNVFPIEELPSEITTLVTESEPSTAATPPIEKTIYTAEPVTTKEEEVTTEQPTKSTTEAEVGTTIESTTTEAEVEATETKKTEIPTTEAETTVTETKTTEAEVTQTAVTTEAEVTQTEVTTEAEVTQTAVTTEAEVTQTAVTTEAEKEVTETAVTTTSEVETTTELSKPSPENITSVPTVTEVTTEQMQPLLIVLRKNGLTKLAEYLDTIYAPKILNLYGLFTLFAPTNEAFTSLPPEELKQLEIDPQALQQMLLYHAISRILPYKDITDKLEIPSIQGRNLTFNVYDNGRVKTVLGKEILRPDIQVMDGIVHVIDKLLYPIPRTTTLQTLDEQFPSFSLAINDSVTRPHLKDKGVTAFIPTEEFWARIPHELREIVFSNVSLLNDIAKNHVCDGQIFKIGVRDGANCTTLSGNTLKFTVRGDNYYVNSVPIIRFDLINTDGIIHVIESPLFLDLLLPEEEIIGLLPPRPTPPGPPTRVFAHTSPISTEYTEPAVTWKVHVETQPTTLHEATSVSTEATEFTEGYTEVSTYHITTELEETTLESTTTATPLTEITYTPTSPEEYTTPKSPITNVTETRIPIVEEVTTTVFSTTYAEAENETESATTEIPTYTTEITETVTQTEHVTEVTGTVTPTERVTEVSETVTPTERVTEVTETVTPTEHVTEVSTAVTLTEHTEHPLYTPVSNDTIPSVLKQQFEDAGYDVDINELNATLTLTEPRRYTAFLPNSAYLQGLPTDILQDLITNKTAFRDVFVNHICPGTIYSQTFTNALSCTTVGGKPLVITVIDGNYYINNLPIIQVDIPAMDGVVHLINGIIFVDYIHVTPIPTSSEHSTFKSSTEHVEVTTEATLAPRVPETTIISTEYPVSTTVSEDTTLIPELSTVALEETTTVEVTTGVEHRTFETTTIAATTSEVTETEVPTATGREAPVTEVLTVTASEAPETEISTATASEAPETEVPTATTSEAPETEIPTATESEAPETEVPTATGSEAPETEVPTSTTSEAPETKAATATASEAPETKISTTITETSLAPELHTTEVPTTYTGVTENITSTPEAPTSATATVIYPEGTEETTKTPEYAKTTEATVAPQLSTEHTAGTTIEIITTEEPTELSSTTISTEHTSETTTLTPNETILSTFKEQFQDAGYDINVTELTNYIPPPLLYTAFLPHSIYLQGLPSPVLQDLVKNNSAVRDVFVNHVCVGATYSPQFSGGFTCNAISGRPIHITSQNGKYYCNDLPIVRVDIPASDGVIHLINGFLIFEPQITSTTTEEYATTLYNVTTVSSPVTTEETLATHVTVKGREFPIEETSTTTAPPAISVTSTTVAIDSTTEVPKYEATTEIEGVTIVVNVTMPVESQVTEEHVTLTTVINQTEVTEESRTVAGTTEPGTSTISYEVTTSQKTSTQYAVPENATGPSTIEYIAIEETETPVATVTSTEAEGTIAEIYTTEAATEKQPTSPEHTVTIEPTTESELVTKTTEVIETTRTRVTSEAPEYTTTEFASSSEAPEYRTSEEPQPSTTYEITTSSTTTAAYTEVGNETSPTAEHVTTEVSTSTILYSTPSPYETILTAIKKLFESLGYDVDVSHLIETLPDTQNYTAFLPNSVYLQGLPSDKLSDLVTNKTAVRDVFVNNICPGVTYSSGFHNGFTCTSVGGQPIVITVINGKHYANDFPIVKVDVPAADGVIHLMNGILYFEEITMTPPTKEETTVSTTLNYTEGTSQTTVGHEAYTTIVTSTEQEVSESTELPTIESTSSYPESPENVTTPVTGTSLLPTAHITEPAKTERTESTTVSENYTTIESTVAYTEETSTPEASQTTTLLSQDNVTVHTEASPAAEYTTAESTSELPEVTSEISREPKEYETLRPATNVSEITTLTDTERTTETTLEYSTPENFTVESISTTMIPVEFTTVDVSTPSPNETIPAIIKQQFEDAGFDIDVRTLIPKLPPTQLYTLFLPYFVYLRGLPSNLIQDFVNNKTLVTETFVDHICPGAIYSSTFKNGFTCTSVGGNPIVITTSDGRYYSNGFPIIRVDIPTVDGVIHLLDGLLSHEYDGITPRIETITTEVTAESSTVTEQSPISIESYTTKHVITTTGIEETTVTPEEYTKQTPEEHTTVAPEEYTTLTPEEHTTVSPEEYTTLTTKERTTLAPEEYTTLTPKEHTTLGPEEYTTGTPEEYTTGTPEEYSTLTPKEQTTLPPERFTYRAETVPLPISTSESTTETKYTTEEATSEISPGPSTVLPEEYTTAEAMERTSSPAIYEATTELVTGPETTELVTGVETTELVTGVETTEVVTGVETTELITGTETTKLITGTETTKLITGIETTETPLEYTTVEIEKLSPNVTIASVLKQQFSRIGHDIDATDFEEHLPSGRVFTACLPYSNYLLGIPQTIIYELVSNKTFVEDLFINHVCNGALYSAQFGPGNSCVSLGGKQINIRKHNGKYYCNNFPIVQTDIPTVDGVVHLINGLLFLEDASITPVPEINVTTAFIPEGTTELPTNDTTYAITELTETTEPETTITPESLTRPSKVLDITELAENYTQTAEVTSEATTEYKHVTGLVTVISTETTAETTSEEEIDITTVPNVTERTPYQAITPKLVNVTEEELATSTVYLPVSENVTTLGYTTHVPEEVTTTETYVTEVATKVTLLPEEYTTVEAVSTTSETKLPEEYTTVEAEYTTAETYTPKPNNTIPSLIETEFSKAGYDIDVSDVSSRLPDRYLYTAFIPHFTFINQFPESTLEDIIKNKTAVGDVFVNHICPEATYSPQFANGFQCTSIEGKLIVITHRNGTYYVNGIPVIQVDIPALDGVVHLINGFLFFEPRVTTTPSEEHTTTATETSTTEHVETTEVTITIPPTPRARAFPTEETTATTSQPSVPVTTTEELSTATPEVTEYETTTEIEGVTILANVTMAVEAQVTEEVTTTYKQLTTTGETTEYSTPTEETNQTEISTAVTPKSHIVEAVTEYSVITENVTEVTDVTTEGTVTYPEITTEIAEIATSTEITEGTTRTAVTTTKYVAEPTTLPQNETILSAFESQFENIGYDINVTELSQEVPDTQLYTAFLPYSIYLQSLPTELLENVVNNNSAVRDVFINHVCPGATYSSQFTDGFTCNALSGKPIFVTHENGQFYSNGFPIIQVDIPALDGVIHLINGFLIFEPQIVSSTTTTQHPEVVENTTLATEIPAVRAFPTEQVTSPTPSVKETTVSTIEETELVNVTIPVEGTTRHPEAVENVTLTTEIPAARSFPTEQITNATTSFEETVSTTEETVLINVTMPIEAQVIEDVTTGYKEPTTVTEEYTIGSEETQPTTEYSEATEASTSTSIYPVNVTIRTTTEYPVIVDVTGPSTIKYAATAETEEATTSEIHSTPEIEASTEKITTSYDSHEVTTSVTAENVTEITDHTKVETTTESLNVTSTTEYGTTMITPTTTVTFIIPSPNETIPSVIEHQFEEAGIPIDITDLNATLPTTQKYTAFIPYSVYLQGLPTDVIQELVTNKTAVRDVFVDHICIEATFSRDFGNRFTCRTVGGRPLTVSIVNGKYYLNNYPIVQVDIPAADGVIHLLSGILHYDKYGVTPPPLEQTTVHVTTEYPEVTSTTESATKTTEIVEYTSAPEDVTEVSYTTSLAKETTASTTLSLNVTETLVSTSAYPLLPVTIGISTTSEHEESTEAEGSTATYEETTSTEVTTEAAATEHEVEEITSMTPFYSTTKYPDVFNITTEVSTYDNVTEVTSVSTMLPTSTSYPETTEATTIPFYPAPEGRGLLSVSIFFYLIDLADVDDILSHGGPYTILAPVDSAFSGLPPQVMRKLEEEPTFLKDVILYHILPMKIESMDLENDNLLRTLQGQDVRCNVYGPVITIGGARVILPDSASGYGVLHIVNKVLYPLPNGTALDTLQPRNDTDKVQNLIRNTTLPRRLQEPGAYTVFIPSDRALNTLPSSIIDALEKNSSLLEEFVLNHMVNGTYYTEGLAEGLELTSMGGQLLRISMAGGLTVNGVPIVTPDISVTNGVVHIIDRILYNPLESIAIPKVEPVVRNDLNVVQLSKQLNLTTFTNLLSKSGLSVNMSEPGPFTVFAPTNEAFAEMPPSQLEGIQSNPEKLQQLLLYHVLPVRLLTKDVTNEKLVPSLVPAKSVRMNIYVNNRGPWYTASGSQILQPNNVASNGIVHVVHQVLYIPLGDIVETVERCSILQTLRHIITVSGLTDDIRVGNFTLLAPNDAAFNKLPEDVLQRLLVDPTIAKAFLLGHLLRGTVNTEGIFDESTMTTLSNNDIYIRALKDCILLNSAAIQYPDVTADNGVVHVIDRVLQVNY